MKNKETRRKFYSLLSVGLLSVAFLSACGGDGDPIKVIPDDGRSPSSENSGLGDSTLATEILNQIISSNSEKSPTVGKGIPEASSSTSLNSGTPFFEPVENESAITVATATEVPINFFPPTPDLVVPPESPSQPQK